MRSIFFLEILFNLPKKSHCGSTDQSSIFDSILIWEIIGGFDRSRHSFNSQESRKIGSIRWYDNQGKKPPHPTNNSCGGSPGIKIRPVYEKKNYDISSRFFFFKVLILGAETCIIDFQTKNDLELNKKMKANWGFQFFT